MCGCKQGTCPGNCPCGCRHTPPLTVVPEPEPLTSGAEPVVTAAAEPNAPVTPDPGAGETSASEHLREVWGIQHPPSVHVEREYPELRWAEKHQRFCLGCVLVHRFVTEWEPYPTASTEDAS